MATIMKHERDSPREHGPRAPDGWASAAGSFQAGRMAGLLEALRADEPRRGADIWQTSIARHVAVNVERRNTCLPELFDDVGWIRESRRTFGGILFSASTSRKRLPLTRSRVSLDSSSPTSSVQQERYFRVRTTQMASDIVHMLMWTPTAASIRTNA